MKDKIEELLNRGVENIYPNKESLDKVLKSDKKIKLYNGIDPTGPLHIGHLVVLRKLRQFQDLGHEVIVLIGDFTAQIGDPTDKASARKKLSREQVEQNAQNYKQLIGKILDVNRNGFKFLHNEEWSNRLKPADMLELASQFTVQQLIERDMFQQRIKAGKEIYLSEFMYPVFQAYDAVTMDVDLQVGGNDQTFNMLSGRHLMKKLKDKEQFVMSLKLLTDPTGKKMGKTEGNIIMLEDSPENIYGKVMAFPDELILIGFEILTDVPEEEIGTMKGEIAQGANPRDAKARLAFELVKQLYSEEKANQAQEGFAKTFRDKQIPENIKEMKASSDKLPLSQALVEFGLAPSRSQAQRLFEQGGVKIDGEVVRDGFGEIEFSKPITIQVGKLNFVKVLPHD